MELFLQYGYGMKEITKSLFEKWNGGTVILSPRDIEQKSIVKTSKEFRKLNGSVLFDPQLYNPRANHSRLTSYDYWPENYSTNVLTDSRSINKILFQIGLINNDINSKAFILPGLNCDKATNDWFTIQEMIINSASEIVTGKKKYATLCLSSETLRNEEQIESILLRSESWAVEGYYVLPQHPNGQYLVDDPVWLSSLLDFCAGLKLQGKNVIVGYSNHQLLCLSASKVDAIASGSWLNVRTFTSSRFDNPEPDEQSRKSTWYYCPQALSEYKVNFLNIAHRTNILKYMQHDESLHSDFASILFTGAQPSDTEYKEGASFRHYLDCLNQQCALSHRNSFKETISSQELLLETAEKFLKLFHNNGVLGQNRDFYEYLDVNRAAITYLEQKRGFVLEREWE
jgi:hypothetical protein